MSLVAMNFNFRPSNYFDDAVHATLATIKGEARRREVLDLIQRGNVEKLQHWMISAKLSDEEREFIGSIHPALMGGEYLPDFLPGEVEIARISLRSVTADVISVRARLEDDKHQYRMVDEYETNYAVRAAQSEAPLTLGELIDLIDFAKGDGTESFVDQLRRNADPDGNRPDATRAFVTVTSQFYPDLSRFYAEECEQWIRSRGNEPQIKYGLHKLIAGISVTRALNIFEFACNHSDTLFITESWFTPRRRKLRELLSDPMVAEEASALCDVVLKRHGLDDCIEWLEHGRTNSWQDFVERKARAAEEAERVWQEGRLRQHLAWVEEIKSMERPACPQCGSKDEVVPIFYGLPASPVLPTYGAFMRGGCVVSSERWHCKRCAPKSIEEWLRNPSAWQGSF